MTFKRKYDELQAVLKARTAIANDLGGVLKEIKEGELWRSEVGDGVQTWHQFLSMPEINLTVTEANQYIKLFDLPISENDKPLISLRNLKFLIGKNLEEGILSDAQVLSHSDLKERHHDVETGSETRTYEYVLMRRVKETGTLSRVNGVESQELESTFKDKIIDNYGS